MKKRGSMLKPIIAIIGASLLLLALYFLNKENFLYGGILGVIGILMLAGSMLPFVKSS